MLRHLLWKEFRQVWQLIVGIVIIQAFVQLMLGLLEMLPSEMVGLSQSAINIALASPSLLAIACCGALIGQKRQTGCWAWSSSLPVTWWQSLVSKLIVWIGASTASLALLLCVAAIALNMNHQALGRVLFSEQTAIRLMDLFDHLGNWRSSLSLLLDRRTADQRYIDGGRRRCIRIVRISSPGCNYKYFQFAERSWLQPQS